MSYYLFLDDARQPRDVNWVELPPNVAWVVARSYEGFVQAIQEMGIPKFIAYDCDLCQEHYDAFFGLKHNYVLKYHDFKTRCGISCLEYLLSVCAKKKIPHPTALVHSRNHYAVAFMEKMIENFNKGIYNPVTSDKELLATPLPAYAEHTDTLVSGFFGKYRFLSNFWPAEVTHEGITFPSVEVAYQSAKCVLSSDKKEFSQASSSEAKQLGKKVIIRPDWESVREGIMEDLVAKKFTNHPELKKQLLATGDKMIVEANSWKDKFWGVAYRYDRDKKGYVLDGGKNVLGTMLMTLRERLKSA